MLRGVIRYPGGKAHLGGMGPHSSRPLSQHHKTMTHLHPATSMSEWRFQCAIAISGSLKGTICVFNDCLGCAQVRQVCQEIKDACSATYGRQNLNFFYKIWAGKMYERISTQHPSQARG